ncbi:MAG: hypothetical protein ACP5OF_05495, partial [bacterium]
MLKKTKKDKKPVLNRTSTPVLQLSELFLKKVLGDFYVLFVIPFMPLTRKMHLRNREVCVMSDGVPTRREG